jgi:archaeal flagellin FlaB
MSRGEMGAGTLIIFIALLLCASVAAGVIIQTSTTLQSKALATGNAGMRQISTHLLIYDITANDGTSTLENMSITVKLGPGSDQISLNSTTITLALHNTTTVYSYSATKSVSNATGTFTSTYLEVGAMYTNGAISRGDLVQLNLQAPRNIAAGEDLRLRVLPRDGLPTVTTFSVPSILLTQYVHLYP